MRLAGLGVVAIASILVFAGGCEERSTGVARRGSLGSLGGHRDAQTLVVGRPADAISLDPARVTDNESVEVIEQLYDPLLRYRPGSSIVEPGLATSWEVDDSGRRWLFHLRRGVRFHDGTPLDADAVVFSFERQRDPHHPYFRRDFEYWHNVYQNIQRVEKVDTYTVRILIERSYAPFLADLAMYPVSIVSPAAVRRYGDDFEHHPIGTGPFEFVAWEPGQRIALRRSEHYWGTSAAMERLVFEVIADPRQRLVALESGSIDLAQAILPEELQFVALHPELVLHTHPANNVTYLAMNTQQSPFDDRRVRQAVNYAVNKEPIVKLLYQGLATPADGPVPPTQWGHSPARQRYHYDPARARALLAEAAADGAFDPEATYTLYAPTEPRPYLPAPEQTARVLAANLAAVGIRTKLVLQRFRDHVQATQAGKHDLVLLGWVGDNGDPDNFLYVLFDRDNAVVGRARNVAFFRDDDVHELLVAARASSSRRERERLYAQVQERLRREAPWVPIAHSQVAIAARDDLAGVLLNPSAHVHYQNVRRVRR